MHCNDKGAPRPGTVMFKVDLSDPTKNSQDASTLVVVYVGTRVCVQQVAGNLDRFDYDSNEHLPSFTEALKRAAHRLREKAQGDTIRAHSMEEQVKKLESEQQTNGGG